MNCIKFDLQRPARNYLKLLAALNTITDDEAYHLTSRRMLPGTTRFILKNLYNCSNLKTLMSQMASGFNFVHGGNFNRAEFMYQSYSYTVDDRDFSYEQGSQPEKIHTILESAMLLVHGVITLCCPQARLRKIKSKNNDNSVLPALLAKEQVQLNAPAYQLIYAACPEVPVDTKILENASFEQIYFAALPDGTKQATLTQTVSALITECRFNQELIAEKLHVSTATLRRKLAEEGVSFRQLCETQRNFLAKQLLQLGLTTQEICSRLSFADERSFIRAFKQWNGVTPNHFMLRCRISAN